MQLILHVLIGAVMILRVLVLSARSARRLAFPGVLRRRLPYSNGVEALGRNQRARFRDHQAVPRTRRGLCVDTLGPVQVSPGEWRRFAVERLGAPVDGLDAFKRGRWGAVDRRRRSSHRTIGGIGAGELGPGRFVQVIVGVLVRPHGGVVGIVHLSGIFRTFRVQNVLVEKGSHRAS